MEPEVRDTPNLTPETVPVKEVSTGLDAIAAKMAAMRNQQQATKPTETGKEEKPVAPAEIESEDYNTESVEPEIVVPEEEGIEGNDESEAPEDEESSVSPEEASEAADIIDFLEFANDNPNAKFRFKRNGKDIEIDAKKAASILGQGAAISEEARQLKVDKAEFDEFVKNKRAESEGLVLALEFTVRPQLQKAYDEIIKVQGYQATFQQQLATATDPAQRARIQAGMQQNEKYIQDQSKIINDLKPKVDQFYDMRRKQVADTLEVNRKNFKDKELRNSYVYDEVKNKIAKDWEGAKGQLVPGVDNIDLITADEHIMSLLRDGLKYRDRPKAKAAGGSIAALTTKRSGTRIEDNSKDELASLQEKARGGDKKAADNLLVAKMNALRAQRNSR
ncbi:MAG TPA: hypothetical protein VFM18_11685 [Methanosarcina sp.]|nr:hypothetical protein [Methanosarcina sp.]